MTQRFKTALASPLFLIMAILISTEVFFLMISSFGRTADSLSMSANSVLVVAAWIFFATKSKDTTPKAAWLLVKIWAIVKAVLQLVFALATLLNGIFLIVGGAGDFDSVSLIVLGILSIFIGTLFRVAMALVYFILFKFISKVMNNAAEDADTEITTKHVVCLFSIAGFEALKLISFFIIRAIISGSEIYSQIEALEEWGISWKAADLSFTNARVLDVANAFNIFDFVMLLFTAGVSIALCVITFLWAKANFSISKASKPKSIMDIAE